MFVLLLNIVQSSQTFFNLVLQEDHALSALSEICAALEGSQLETLDLSDNALGEKGVRACAGALKGQVAFSIMLFCLSF